MAGAAGTGRDVKTGGAGEPPAGGAAVVGAGGAEGAPADAEGAMGATVDSVAPGVDAGAPAGGAGDTRGAGAPNTGGCPSSICCDRAGEGATVTARGCAAGAGGVPTGRDYTGPIGAGTRSV